MRFARPRFAFPALIEAAQLVESPLLPRKIDQLIVPACHLQHRLRRERGERSSRHRGGRRHGVNRSPAPPTTHKQTAPLEWPVA